MNKIRLLKAVDLLIGKGSCLFLRHYSVKTMEACQFRRILFIRPGGIGDAVLLLPAIAALSEAYPQANIDILAEKRNCGVFSLSPYINKVLLYDRSADLLTAIRGTYDVVIDTEQWHRLSALVARLTRGPVSIGYGTNERRRLFSHVIPYSHDEDETSSFFHLLEPLQIGKPAEIKAPYLFVRETAAGKARGLLSGFANTPFVAIFPGASIPERRWGADKFRKVAELLQVRGIPVVVIGGKEDVLVGDRIIADIYGLNLAGTTSLMETAAVIDKSCLLVSGDSGILHIGVGLGKSTISLFGPGRANKWAPRGNKHIVINKCPPCSPCTRFGYTPKCPIHAKCMSDITVDDVFESIIHLMNKTDSG